MANRAKSKYNPEDGVQLSSHEFPSFEKDGYGKRRSISSIAEQSPLFEFEGFVIKEFDGWHMWMENPSGEGATISKIEFKNILAKIFNEHF